MTKLTPAAIDEMIHRLTEAAIYREHAESPYRVGADRELTEATEAILEQLGQQAAAPGVEQDAIELLRALVTHVEAMEAHNHDYHALAEYGIPRVSEPLGNAIAFLAALAVAPPPVGLIDVVDLAPEIDSPGLWIAFQTSADRDKIMVQLRALPPSDAVSALSTPPVRPGK